ncbi:MAG TPA: hypothetical protein VJC16_00690 [Candidatus Nanoarchaeia archaeon]|nr:hypothetical protein [Candidatus Nanoarchaeia archaeon]
MLEKLAIKYGWRSDKGYVSQIFSRIIRIARAAKDRESVLAFISQATQKGSIAEVQKGFRRLIRQARAEGGALSDLNLAIFTLVFRLEKEIHTVAQAIQKAAQRTKDAELQALLQELHAITGRLQSALEAERAKSRDLRYLNRLPRDMSGLTEQLMLKVMANDARAENNLLSPLKAAKHHILALSRAHGQRDLITLKQQIKSFEGFAKGEITALVEEEDYALVLLFKLIKSLAEQDAQVKLLESKGFPQRIARNIKEGLESVERRIAEQGARAAWANEFLEKRAA